MVSLSHSDTLSVIRLTSWNEAQRHCESEKRTLLQHTGQVKYYGLTLTDFPAEHEFGEVIFFGLKRNKQILPLIECLS